MKPVFARAKPAPKRVVYAEGEEERVLRAVQVVVDEGLARPVLIGRPEVIGARVEKFGLRLAAGRDFDLVNINSDPRYKTSWQLYYQLMGRNGISPEDAKEAVLRKPSLIGTLLLQMGECDALLCGTAGKYNAHLRHVADVIGRSPDAPVFAAMNGLLLPNRTLFICDTYVNRNPTAEHWSRSPGWRRRACRASAWCRGGPPLPFEFRQRRFEVGAQDARGAADAGGARAGTRNGRRNARRRRAVRDAQKQRPSGLDAEGRGQPARDAEPRRRQHLVQPVKINGGEGVTIGPILLGARKPVLIATPSATVRRLVNLTALAVVGTAAGEE